MRGAQPNMADTGRTTCVHACHPGTRVALRIHACARIVSYVSVHMWRYDQTRARKRTNSLFHVNGRIFTIFGIL